MQIHHLHHKNNYLMRNKRLRIILKIEKHLDFAHQFNDILRIRNRTTPKWSVRKGRILSSDHSSVIILRKQNYCHFNS